MLSSMNTTNTTAPALDETLPPITVGRRTATAQEARAIDALNAVLDDQPAPPKTLFDYTGMAAELRRPRPSVNRVRVKATTALANEQAMEALAPALMVDVRVNNDETNGEDYTPAFVSPGFERIHQPAQPQTAIAVTETDVVSTRDEALAVAREVHDRVMLDGDKNVDKAAGEVMMTDMMPFGNATLRLFCC